MGRYGLIDPVNGKTYEYVTNNDKEDRLFKALQMSLRDQCPPDTSDYVCLKDDTDETQCESCWLYWATKDFSRKTR